MKLASLSISDLLFGSEEVFEIQLAELPPSDFWSDLQILLKEGKCMQLQLSKEVLFSIQSDVLLQNRLRMLWSEGLEAVMNEAIQDHSLVRVNRSLVYIIRTEKSFWTVFKDRNNRLTEAIWETEYIKSIFEKNLAPLKVKIPQKTVLSGDVVEISSNASSFEHISCNKGITIPNSGYITFKATAPTWWIFDAVSNGVIQRRAYYLNVVQTLHIKAEVRVYNLLSKQYDRIEVLDTDEPVYGLPLGTKVLMEWHVDVADTVRISPFGKEGLSGSIAFEINGNQQIEIEANLGSKTEHKSLHIRAFSSLNELDASTFDLPTATQQLSEEMEKWQFEMLNQFEVISQKRNELESKIQQQMQQLKARHRKITPFNRTDLVHSFKQIRLQIAAQLRTLTRQ